MAVEEGFRACGVGLFCEFCVLLFVVLVGGVELWEIERDRLCAYCVCRR